MTGYIDPFLSDEELIGRDTKLSRKRAREDFLVIRAQGGFDAALFAGEERPSIEEGFRKIPGASRSGALDPQTRSQMLRQEHDGLIELQRDGRGFLVAYRPIDNTND